MSNPVDELLKWLAEMPRDFKHAIETLQHQEQHTIRHLPFQVGDRVEIIKAVNFTESYGWQGCEEMMEIGQTAVVKKIYYNQFNYGGDGGWSYQVEFEDEWTVSNTGYPPGEGQATDGLYRTWNGKRADMPAGYKMHYRYEYAERDGNEAAEGFDRRHQYSFGEKSLQKTDKPKPGPKVVTPMPPAPEVETKKPKCCECHK